MKKFLLIALLAALSSAAHAQLFIDTSYTANQMITNFFNGAGVTVSNVTYTGANGSLSFFEGSQSNLNMNAGLLITSGRAEKAIGPNNIENAGVSMGLDGTSWLDVLIPGYKTFDASVITMDVVPTTDTLCFRYVFGSEEYKEYVNSQYNDVFAFFIEGPGFAEGDSIWVAPDTAVIYNPSDSSCYVCVDTLIVNEYWICDSLQIPGSDTCIWFYDTLTQYCYWLAGPDCSPFDTIYYPGYWYYSPGGTNIAQIPNTNLPVTINTLNQNQFSQYFYDNDQGLTIQYDGFTTPLWAKAVVTPGETYKIRIAVADAGDQIYDSGVFIGIESLGGDSLLEVEPAFVVSNSTTNTNVKFTNHTLWATSWFWDFGDGATSNERFPEHTYAQPGLYTVKLTAKNWCSSETITQEVAAGITATGDVLAKPFRLLPNPTVDGRVRLDLAAGENADVQLATLDGRLLFSGNLQDNAVIDLNAYGKGLYLLQVVDGGKVYTERVVNR